MQVKHGEPRIYADCAVCKSDIDVTKYVPSGMSSMLKDAYRKKYKLD